MLCHALPDADGPFGNVGPSLAGIGAKRDAGELRQRIVDPTRVDAANDGKLIYVNGEVRATVAADRLVDPLGELLAIGRAMGRAKRGTFGMLSDFEDEKAELWAWIAADGPGSLSVVYAVVDAEAAGLPIDAAHLPELRKLGVSVSLGADGAPCNNNLNMFQEMRLASLLQKPLHGPRTLPAREVFEMATIEGARALGIEQDVGSIEVGKKADLVALEMLLPSIAIELNEKEPEKAYSALAYSASPESVKQTWVDGRLVFHEGSFPGNPVREIVAEAMRERRKLLQRLRN